MLDKYTDDALELELCRRYKESGSGMVRFYSNKESSGYIASYLEDQEVVLNLLGVVNAWLEEMGSHVQSTQGQ